jgi:hypothetical protein
MISIVQVPRAGATQTCCSHTLHVSAGSVQIVADATKRESGSGGR